MNTFNLPDNILHLRGIPSNTESFVFFGVPQFEEELEEINYGVDLSTI